MRLFNRRSFPVKPCFHTTYGIKLVWTFKILIWPRCNPRTRPNAGIFATENS